MTLRSFASQGSGEAQPAPGLPGTVLLRATVLARVANAFARLSLVTALFAVPVFAESGAARDVALKRDERPASGKNESVKEIAWQGWREDVFKEAQKQKKLVILDLVAVWCHWCHVMEEQTYSRPEVRRLINEHFIALKVDQDSRPDLSNRYRNWGWPATIFFDSRGREIAKRAGFIEPEEMEELLARLIENPEPEIEKKKPVEYSDSAVLDAKLKEQLVENYYSSADEKIGGLTISKRFIDADTVEYALRRAFEGNKRDAAYAKVTLDSNKKLQDPAWGGIYQYSTHRGWDRPHFEKIVPTQTNSLRVYSFGAKVLKDASYIAEAKKIVGYLDTFLTSPEGAFYTSQDADLVKGEHSEEYFRLGDKQRRAKGVPAVDKHVYGRENGLLIQGLAALYGATGDSAILARAKKAADWIMTHRSRDDGGFNHDEKDVAGPYLADSLEMGRGLLALYEATGERALLARSEKAAKFIESRFVSTDGERPGFATTVFGETALEPAYLLSENIDAARYFNQLHHYTGNEEYKKSAERAMRYAATPAVVLSSVTEPGVLIASTELSRPPLHVTIVAPKGDSKGLALFQEALKYPELYKRTEWWDKTEGPMPNPDVQYPQLNKAAAFVCTNKRCSLPIFEAAEVPKMIEFLSKGQSA